MISEILELWNWFYGLIAGWGLTTVLTVVALIILWIKHLRLKREVSHLYNRIVSAERDWSLKNNRDR